MQQWQPPGVSLGVGNLVRGVGDVGGTPRWTVRNSVPLLMSAPPQPQALALAEETHRFQGAACGHPWDLQPTKRTAALQSGWGGKEWTRSLPGRTRGAGRAQPGQKPQIKMAGVDLERRDVGGLCGGSPGSF